jgi:hypothetical protein
MKTIEVLSAAAIKDGMTKGVWVSDEHHDIIVTSEKDGNIICLSPINLGFTKSAEHFAANAAAITTAVNATYGQGYDPLMVDKMYKMLWGLAHEAKLHKHEQLAIHELLKQCKI